MYLYPVEKPTPERFRPRFRESTVSYSYSPQSTMNLFSNKLPRWPPASFSESFQNTLQRTAGRYFSRL
jgi:hypothetical protein